MAERITGVRQSSGQPSREVSLCPSDAELERQRFVALAERCTEFIGICDLQFKPFFVNDAGLRLVGLDSLEQACSVQVQDFFFPEDQPFIMNEFFPKVLREKKAEVEIRFRHFKTGAAIWMIYNVFYLNDEDGKPVGLATFSQNIAERKRIEEALHEREAELRKVHEDLTQKVEERTEQLAGSIRSLQSEMQVRKKTEQQLRELSARLLRLQDEERRRIARDLHDSTGQTLTALKLTLTALESAVAGVPGVRNLLQDLDALADQALQEIRTTSYLLHPPLLDEGGFSPAAQWYVEGFGKRSGIRTTLDISALSLTREEELVFFRVLQEGLTNVLRHSGSTAVDIRLYREGEDAALSIRDYGKGIPPEILDSFQQTRAGVGVGLGGMKQRVRELGGHLRVECSGTGTCVTATLPLVKAELHGENGGS